MSEALEKGVSTAPSHRSSVVLHCRSQRACELFEELGFPRSRFSSSLLNPLFSFFKRDGSRQRKLQRSAVLSATEWMQCVFCAELSV